VRAQAHANAAMLVPAPSPFGVPPCHRPLTNHFPLLTVSGVTAYVITNHQSRITLSSAPGVPGHVGDVGVPGVIILSVINLTVRFASISF
jgi:hypothetical protein